MHPRCSFHYQGFYKSIDQLWAVKKEFESLRTEVATLNTKVQATGRLVLNTSEELARKRRILHHIDETQAVINTAHMCIGLLDRSRHDCLSPYSACDPVPSSMCAPL